jgi:hypothetical protein
MLYVFNTWVVANLLHPILIYLVWGGMDGEFLHDEIVRAYFLILPFSFVFSLPALIIAWFIFYMIKRIDITVISKFITWTLIVTVLPLIVWFCSFGDWDLQKEDLELIMPSSIAAIASIFIRIKQFFKLFNY